MEKNKRFSLNISVGSADEKAMKELQEAVKRFNGVMQIIREDTIEDEEFNPNPGQVCTLCQVPGIAEIIFVYNGENHLDDDGNRWLGSDLSLELTNNLLYPYRVDKEKGQEFFANLCRACTKEEGEFYRSKMKELSDKRPGMYIPNAGEDCFIPQVNTPQEGRLFFCVKIKWTGNCWQRMCLQRSWVCSTERQCEKLCDLLNESVSNVKL